MFSRPTCCGNFASSIPFALWGAALVSLMMPGCARWHMSHYGSIGASGKTSASTQTDSAAAAAHHRRALSLMASCDFARAEERLRMAIAADSEFGPAHNNLGKIHYRCGRYYDAAREFEIAVGLMPDRPEPLNNLGLVFEAAERFPDAVANFQLARELDPTNPVYVGNLARAMLREEYPDRVAISSLLDELMLVETRSEWRDWVMEQRASMADERDQSIQEIDGDFGEDGGAEAVSVDSWDGQLFSETSPATP